MNIDLHSHFVPIEAFQNPGKYRDKAPKVAVENGRLTLTSGGGTRPNMPEGSYDAAARIKDMDKINIDLQAISPSPIMLFYWEEPAAAAYFSRLQNDALQAVAAKHPNRFVAFGSVPLQSVPESIAIAEEAKKSGLKGLEIGTAVGDKQLDAPVFEPFFEAAEALDLLLFVHPVEDGIDTDDPLNAMLGNVLHFPFRTTMMIERMILKGMFEKYKNLRLCLSHAGGLVAYNIWRLDHAYEQRAEFRKNIGQKPSTYLKQMYFDTILHSVAAIEYLIRAVGADRVVIGTDYPMAMGDFDPVGRISEAKISDAERKQILGTNAAKAINL